jgi:hypothetical protein
VGWPRLTCRWTRNLSVFAQVKAKREDLTREVLLKPGPAPEDEDADAFHRLHLSAEPLLTVQA